MVSDNNREDRITAALRELGEGGLAGDRRVANAIALLQAELDERGGSRLAHMRPCPLASAEGPGHKFHFEGEVILSAEAEVPWLWCERCGMTRLLVTAPFADARPTLVDVPGTMAAVNAARVVIAYRSGSAIGSVERCLLKTTYASGPHGDWEPCPPDEIPDVMRAELS